MRNSAYEKTSVTANVGVKARIPRIFKLISFISYLLLYAPLFVLVVFSFCVLEQINGGLAFSVTWTLDWYSKIFKNELVLEALKISLQVGVWSTLGATVIGTLGAYAIIRTKFLGRKIFDTISLIPLIMPEIVLGIAILIWFVMIGMDLGLVSIIIAHISFTLSYVIITVKTRLIGFDKSVEEAGLDLGASPFYTFLKITLPLIWPGIVSAALMAFTLSFDDFLITFFTAGAGTDTLPLKIYSMIKFGVSPEINALSTLMLLTTFLLVLLFFRPGNKESFKRLNA